jgi:peptide/nickel transport system substrate-binding protein
LDPVRAYDSASGGILENVYETLYTFNDPAIDEFVPALATSYSVSDDGTTWTFQLREGVQFHSGNAMSCKDVEYSLQYGMVVSHPEGAVSFLMGEQFLGTLTDGSDPEAFQAEVSFDMIDGAVECPDGPDGLVVDLNLATPDPAVLAILAYVGFGVIDSQFAIENGQWDGTEATWTDWIGRNVTEEFLQRNTSGTGPYQLVEWTEEALVAKRFDDYWGGAAPIENVVVQYVNEQSTRTLAIQQGDADVIDVPLQQRGRRLRPARWQRHPRRLLHRRQRAPRLCPPLRPPTHHR